MYTDEIVNLSHTVKNLIDKTKYYMHFQPSAEKRRLIKKNIELKGKYNQKRCFVLGNGPSLRNQDLSLLRDEYVFTVNQIARLEVFPEIKSNFHFWADPIFFDLDPNKPEDMELLGVFKKINTDDNTPICFLPVEAYDFCKRFELNHEMDIRFYYAPLWFTDNYRGRIDYSQIGPAFYTVVQYAIATAIFMGFSEIYLLGCDSTGIVGLLNNYLNEDNGGYAYEMSYNEKKRLKNTFEMRSIEDYFASWQHIMHGYKELYKYCCKKGITLLNCSDKTVIDTIPRKKYEEIINSVANEKQV